MKRAVFFVPIFLFLCTGGVLFSQEADGSTAEEPLEYMLRGATTLVLQELRSHNEAELEIGRILLENRPVMLGEYLAAALPIRLSSRGGHDISVNLQPGQGEYRLEGKAFNLGDRVQLFLSLINSAGKIVGGQELSLPASSALQELLRPVTNATGDRYEPDSHSSPLALIPGEIISERSLDPAGDTDWYRLDYRDGEESSIVTIATTGALDTYIEVYQADDPVSPIAENDDAQDENARVSVGIEPGDVLLIAVRGYDNSVTGSYQVISSLEALPEDSSEPNNRQEQAGRLIVNATPVEHRIYPIGDIDWYRITLNDIQFREGSYLDLRTAGTLDTYAELYDADGNLLAEDDDGGSENNARIMHALNNPSGPFFLLVRHYDDSEIGEYRLAASITQVQADRFEPDNTWDSAREIQLPAPGRSSRENLTFSDASDRDWVRFSVTETMYVEMRSEGDLDTILSLYNNEGELLEESDDEGDEYNGLIERILPPGIYRLEVRQYEDNAQFNAEYRLRFSVE